MDTASNNSSPTGTYSISATCIGTMTLNVNGTSRHYNFLMGPVAGGVPEFSFNEVDSGAEMAITATHTLDPSGGCIQSMLNGHILSSAISGGVGGNDSAEIVEISFKADGTYQLTGQGSVNGQQFTGQGTGTYAVGSDCNVTLFVTDQSSARQSAGTVQLQFRAQDSAPVSTLAIKPQATPANIMDQCPTCAHGGLDLTPSLFENVAGKGTTGWSQGPAVWY